MRRSGSTLILALLPGFLITPGGPAAAQGAAAGSGPYSPAQAVRGQSLYENQCAACHSTARHSGDAFALEWQGRTAYELFTLISGTMPENDPGSMSAEEYTAVVAYILKINGVPAGRLALPSERPALESVTIDIKRPPAGKSSPFRRSR